MSAPRPPRPPRYYVDLDNNSHDEIVTVRLTSGYGDKCAYFSTGSDWTVREIFLDGTCRRVRDTLFGNVGPVRKTRNLTQLLRRLAAHHCDEIDRKRDGVRS